MKPKVIRFFEENRYNLDRLFAAGAKQGLKKHEVYAGMEAVYRRVRRRESIKRINLARRAFAFAREAKSAEYQKEFHDMINSKKLLDDARATIAELEERLRRKSFWSKFINWSQTGNFR